MKNKGRRQKAINHNVDDRGLAGIGNCKGCLSHITRPIKSMSSKGLARGKYEKKKWSKRVRGYFKSQTKELL